ncbi:hypothetical protein QFZ34_001185 [Phyllobacterium ifriqiyense]|uniref:Uncharacterized protein n=1 Tax=Phyllobacterium ifriqiyense TaxID=314238 RepID=A0ABU0S8F0_9HYPH|nr:hypothetical protein [Phyllobacterium ifriqiyense]MDQ0996008.1 hypothetical protein [Phyllobacterium ifriqiyense]
MFIQTFVALGYTESESKILVEAQRLASQTLSRDTHTHEYSERMAATIIDFYKRGIKDPGIISTLVVNREMALEQKREKDKRTAQRRIREQKRRSRSAERPDDLSRQ